ncbi:MAG: hypothetical protein G01um10148_873 [Parcubacteria group bacterium Gr01-1014_8]|nr:MAG: hypothetical protein G01um10148_873 [Parcubacteria group bacterium Gr01-1014_8]
MKYFSIFGWAVVIYAVMFLLWSGFVIYGVAGAPWAWLLQIGTLVIVTTIAARSLGAVTWQDMLLYSLSWSVLVALLDMVFSVPFAGWSIYYKWRVWLGYALVALVPILSVKWLPSPRDADN